MRTGSTSCYSPGNLARSLSDKIEALAAQRHAAWARGDYVESVRLAVELEKLYEEKRREAAPHGSPAAHTRAIKRAVAERELERLMSS